MSEIDRSDKLSYYLFNGHGDVVQTTSENGTVENQYDYDIFGNATLTVEAYSNAIRYGGEFFDADGGLYYLKSRYYDPYIGRFVTQDSFSGNDTNPLSLNLYTYCENDPINFLDPTGHYPETVAYDPNHYNSDVAYLQQQLNNHGYGLDVDGYFGRHTLDAVKDYQYRHNLEVDGIVGPHTWGSLLSHPESRPTQMRPQTPDTSTDNGSCNGGSTTTSSGSGGSGGIVRYNPNTYNPEAARVQRILNEKGANLVVDGYFGDNTLAAVKQFQRANGLDDDGIVGPKTWGMLLSDSSVYYGGSRRNNSRPAIETDLGTGKTDSQVDIYNGYYAPVLTKDEAEKYIDTWGYNSNEIEKLPGQIAYNDNGYTYVYALTPAHTIFEGIDLGPSPILTLPNGKTYDPNIYGYHLVYNNAPKVSKGIVTISSDEINPSAFGDLAKMRQELGLPIAGSALDKATISKLEIGEQDFYGINAHGQGITLKVNAISKTHAEADAFQQAVNAGVTSGKAVLIVDRDLCKACGQNGAVESMASQLGIKELTVISPSGTTVIKIN